MKKLTESEKVVNLISSVQAWGERLDYNNYDSKLITEVRPAILEDGKYTDLRTGEELQLKRGMQVWELSVGNVLEYPDGKMFLISRLVDKDRTRVIFADDEGNWRYSPSCMVKHKVFKREVKKEDLY